MITISYPKACEIWQATDDDAKSMRNYAHAVQVHPAGYLMATDGHIAAIVRCGIIAEEVGWPGMMIPADFLKEASKNCQQSTVEITLRAGELLARNKKGGCIVGYPAEGLFPRLDIIVKQALNRWNRQPVHHVGLNPWLLARVALAIGCPKGQPIFHRWAGPENPALVFSDEPKTLGLIMPGSVDLARSHAEVGHAKLTNLIDALTTDRPARAA